MKALMITSMLALAAPVASAGDLQFDFGFGRTGRHSKIRVNVGYRDDHRGHDQRRVHRDVHRHVHRDVHRDRGHWETVARRVWIPGHYDVVHRPAAYGYRYDACGARVRYVVRPACTERIWCRGRYETRHERVWVSSR
jgi:hypothetical protein